MADAASDIFLPIYPVAGAYRIRLSGAIVGAMGWLSLSDPFQCLGVFRSDGELLCAPTDVATVDGRHPLESALRFRQEHDLPLKATRLEDVPPPHSLAMRYVVVDFVASWVSKHRKNNQVDLQIGSAHTGLLGWVKGAETPIYPFPLPPILCLLSQRKIESIQRTSNFDISGHEGIG